MARITKDNIDKFYEYDVDLTTRTVYIGSQMLDNGEESGINALVAERTIKALHLLEAQAPNGDKPITVILNSPGGDVYHGMAIYGAIKACKNHVTIIVYGMAMSMAALILQAADERVIDPMARVMIHYGAMELSSSHTKIFGKWAEEVKKLDKIYFNLLLEKIKLKNPNFKDKQLEDMLNFDTIFNAEETTNIGLADKILGT